MRLLSALLLVGLWLCCSDGFAQPAPGPQAKSRDTADFYVSPDGNDAWSGTLAAPSPAHSDGPFATLTRARDAVRQLLAEQPRGITVLIRGGTYRLSETVRFGLEDGRENVTITYAAYPGEEPVLSGGRPITGWKKPSSPPAPLPEVARDKVWVADVSDRQAFHTLYAGRHALPRARSEGFSPVNSTPRGSTDYQTVEFAAGAFQVPEDLADVQLRIIPSRFWVMNLLDVESIDVDKRILRTTQPGTYPLGRNAMTDRPTAWLENALEHLRGPGQWVLDRSEGRLYLWPPQEPIPNIVAPVLTELIRVEGDIDYDGPRDEPVRGIVLRGLTFRHGDRLAWHGRTGWGLQHDWECFDKPTALVRFRGAEDCAVEDCTFENSGHTAVRLDLHCQRIGVRGNHIHHMGGVGVLLAGYGPGTKDVNRDNEVVNNYIHHIGREYWGSVAIFAWQSGRNRIAHNHVHHIPYTAILSTGRIVRTPPGPAECSRTIRWDEVPEGFARAAWHAREPYLHARNNLIEYNEIHHAMEKLGDGNCIYVSGAGGGTKVRYNYSHHCYGKYMNAVIRCDDDQHETLMQGNICYHTAGHGEGFISKGDNDIINNVVADLRPDQRHRGYIVFPYGSITGTTIERNILYSQRKDQILYHHGRPTRRGEPPRLRDATVNRNLYCCTEDDAWAQEHFAQQRPLGNEIDSLEADPKFVDPVAANFRFQDDSPARALGIQPLDASAAGLRPAYRERFLGRRLTTRITPDDQTLRAPVRVIIRCSDPRAAIHYTLDGKEPTPRSEKYAGPFVIEEPAVVRARGFAQGASDPVGARVVLAAPPAPIVQDFESVPVGAPAPGATTAEDARLKQYTVRVTDQLAAGGERSLEFVDGPGQKARYTPHIFYRCRYDQGKMLGRFDLRVGPRAALYYQWRQYDNGYVAGPTVTIEPGGKVVHAGRPLLTIPAEQWVTFEVSCGLADEADGTFDLRVWLPGESEPRVHRGLKQSPEFARLDWVGIASRSEEDATYYIDNMVVREAKARPGGQ